MLFSQRLCFSCGKQNRKCPAEPSGNNISKPKKTFMRANLLSLFVLFGCLQLHAIGFAQTVSLKADNKPLTGVFTEIESQTGMIFMYSKSLLQNVKTVSIELKNVPLDDALKKIFSNQPLMFKILDKTIVLSEKNQSSKGNTQINGIDIHGTVVDDKGNPLSGATIRIKGGNRSTKTNSIGEFIMPVVDQNVVLVVSYTGYQSQEIIVGESQKINVRLKLLEVGLQEVAIVSTGYQKIPIERATGSFKSIDSAQLDKPTNNLAQRLIGSTAGLAAITTVDGTTSFRIRGLSSLSAASEPLVVVDGFAIQGSFNTINPNNIESVTILKDAAAASIWGARSANGVIVVTTKTGHKGKTFTADVTAFTRIGTKFDLDYARNLASSSETVAFEQLAYGKWVPLSTNAGTLAQVGTGPWSQAITQMNEFAIGRINLAQRDSELQRLSTLDNRQQIKDYILDNPVTNQINVNLTGSSGKMNQALSLLYETNSTYFQGSENKKWMVNYRTDANLFKWLNLELGLMLQDQISKNNGFTLADVKSWSPYDMIKNPDGSLINFPYGYYMPSLSLIPANKFPYDFYYNPVRELNDRDYSSESLNGRLQTGLTAKIFNGLSVSSRIQYENFNTFNRNRTLEDAFAVRSLINNTATWDRTATGSVVLNLPKGDILDQNRSKFSGYNWRNQISYDRTIGRDHAINFIAGTELRSSTTQTFINPTTYGYNDQTLAVGQFPNGPGGTGTGRAITTWFGVNQTFGYTNSFTYLTDRFFSSFANLNYTYRNKYTLSGSFRTDASNLIAADNSSRYSPFWSVGGSWQVSKEQFIRNLTWVDKLNARLTFGYNGNEDRSTSPFALISISATPNTNTGATTATISNFGNPTLRWEKTGTLNAGIDFSIFDGKLFGSVDAYNKRGKDLLALITIPAVNGTTSQRLNNIEMYNKGIEIELGSIQNISSNIRWKGNFSFAYNKNKITKLFITQYTANALAGGTTAAYVEGENANTLWSYQYAGLVNGSPVYLGPDNTKINFGQNLTSDARSWMTNNGVTVAPYTLGMVNSFDIYGFNLSFILTGKFGAVYRNQAFNYPIQGGKVLPNGRLSDVINGDPNLILTLPTNNTDPTYRIWNSQYQYLSYNVSSANLVRVQEVNLSYAFKPAILQKLHVSGVVLFVQGNNLHTFVNNEYNEDPEYPIGTIKPTAQYTMGFKLKL